MLLLISPFFFGALVVLAIVTLGGRRLAPVDPVRPGRYDPWHRRLDRRFGPGTSTGLFALALGLVLLLGSLSLHALLAAAERGSFDFDYSFENNASVLSAGLLFALPVTVTVIVAAALRGRTGRILGAVALAAVGATFLF